MDDALYRSLLNGNPNATYTKMNRNKSTHYFEALFSNEKRMSVMIQTLVDAATEELYHLWNSRLNFEFDEKLLIEEAYNWMSRDGQLLKVSLIETLPSVFQEQTLYVFEQSMERLMEHFTRKQQFWRTGSNLETYIEWLLELPYLVKERLESALTQAPLESPITHYENRKNNSTPVYRMNVEPEETRASGIELALCC